VPRWAGRPESDYYPWLLARLAAEHPDLSGPFDEARVLVLPRPEQPDVSAWPAAIASELQLRGDAARLERTFVLAHSVGCQALLRALGTLPEGAAIGGALCVAGWWQIDRPWDSIRPWLEPMPSSSLERARAAVRTLRVLLSDNDPFTADHVRNAERWQELGAGVRLAPGGRHFNNPEEPAVLAALLELVGTTPR
jgi:hypothetical protein